MATPVVAAPAPDTLAGRLPGVGPALGARLATLGLRRVADLLWHLPLRYEDHTTLTELRAVAHGLSAQVCATVVDAQLRQGRRRMLLVQVEDPTGTLTLRFFHFTRAQQDQLRPGVRLLCFGEARRGLAGMEMVHPRYRVLTADAAPPVQDRLSPVYPAAAGIGQAVLRRLVTLALERELAGLDELLPAALRAGRPTLADALRTVHSPPPGTDLAALQDGRHPAVQRLALEELLAHQVALRTRRRVRERDCAPVLASDGALRARLLAGLPFAPTGAQQRATDEILADLARPVPMLRLLQGDVGAGKTLVAALAAAQVVQAGAQVALMAPTELLAQQHHRNLSSWLVPLGLDVLWLAGRHTGRTRARVLDALESGAAPVVVGTHALVQDTVRFARLGLIVVDEQHRFGVDQRLALRAKGADGLTPHQLVMTATPIPRSLAMTLYADLDISVLDELPPGRTPVETVAVPLPRRDELIARVAHQCQAGRQAYWVCPLIEDDPETDVSAAARTAQELTAALPAVRVGLLHGRMKGREKEAVMRQFKAGALDLLVATTVVEVGVDVPNASLMIIENAERLGLAQLHQLRGRVGRGAAASACVLLYRPPLGDIARARLATLRAVNDGFEIARRDLELRGAGELLGTRQTGLLDLRVADLARDQVLLEGLGALAATLERDYPAAAAALIARWLPDALHYAQV